MNLGPTKRNCASVAFSATAPVFFSPFATSARRCLPVVGKSLRRERSGWQRCRPVCPTLSTTLAKVSVRKPQKIYDNMFQLQCRRPRLVCLNASLLHTCCFIGDPLQKKLMDTTWHPNTQGHGLSVAAVQGSDSLAWSPPGNSGAAAGLLRVGRPGKGTSSRSQFLAAAS